MKPSVRPMTPIFACLLWLVGCGGNSVGNGGSGAQPPDSQTVSSLNDSQRAQVCDWVAELWGGYGTTVSCGNATLSAPDSQAACIAKFPDCSATVGQLKACNEAIYEAQCDAITNGLPQACTSLPPSCITSG